MRKIKTNEREKGGMRYCTFCKPERVDAIWRSQWRGGDKSIQFACEIHKDLIEDGPKPDPKGAECKERDYYTEADCQTWLRL